MGERALVVVVVGVVVLVVVAVALFRASIGRAGELTTIASFAVPACVFPLHVLCVWFATLFLPPRSPWVASSLRCAPLCVSV